MSEIIELMRRAVADHDSVAGALYDLQSWLPSAVVGGLFHGDYSFQVHPGGAEIVKEATAMLAILAGYESDYPFYECPCGEGCEAAAYPNDDAKPEALEGFRNGMSGTNPLPQYRFNAYQVAYRVGELRRKKAE